MKKNASRLLITIFSLCLLFLIAVPVNAQAAGLKKGSYRFSAYCVKSVKVKGNQITVTLKNKKTLVRDPHGGMNQYFGCLNGAKETKQNKFTVKVSNNCHLYSLQFVGPALAEISGRTDCGKIDAKEIKKLLIKKKCSIFISVKNNKIQNIEYVAYRG